MIAYEVKEFNKILTLPNFNKSNIDILSIDLNKYLSDNIRKIKNILSINYSTTDISDTTPKVLISCIITVLIDR